MRTAWALVAVALLVAPALAQQDRSRARAENWGGIEGEPIRLDSPDPRHREYLQTVSQQIKANWGYPCVKNTMTLECEYRDASLLVRFGILASGHLQATEIVRSSGIPIYDGYAVSAIRLGAPYPPVPDAMLKTMKPGSTGIAIDVGFTYTANQSTTTTIPAKSKP